MKGIKKTFGTKVALDDIHFSVANGEIFGLLGPSGAGKTTIIRILTGQIHADEGESILFGENTKKLSEQLYGKIGMVLDNSGLYTRLTCYDNLIMFCQIYGIHKDEIDRVLEEVELTEARKRPVSKLSKGMMQRLILARAIIHKPQILFLDEPTSGLDPATAYKIHHLIFELRKNGTTVFLTTHNMEEASLMCDHVVLLNDGKIVEYGSPDELCRKYNKSKSVKMMVTGKGMIELPNDGSAAREISEYFMENLVETIHSGEPNLEAVFLKLTGRRLV